MGGGVEDDRRARRRRTRRWWWQARGGTAGACPVEGGDSQSLHKLEFGCLGNSPRATTTTIGLRGLHCCPSFLTGFALAHRVLTDQALCLAALRQRHVLQLGESSAAADGSCTFKVLCCLSAS
ncbi:hypothetical protein ACQ4PT_040183 [Festuca glaucescens]